MSRLLRVKLSPQVLNGFLCRGYCWLSRQNHPVITGLQLCKKECKSQNHLVKFLRYNGAVTHLKCQHTLPPGARPQKQKSVVIKPDMTVRQLAQDMGVQPASVADLVIDLGEELQNGFNTVLSPDLAELLLLEYDMIPIHLEPTETTRTSTSMLPRPPVVTIMGHVDHGKTTLLDTLRKTSVAAGEAGGITQHIGAFSVNVSGGERTITFIDTPGHAAFETMRARGANITDVVVLVVAADEGVKPQTVESIKHATNARVPIIVAVNKMDKPRVNVEKAKQQLLQHGIQLEEFGGDIQAVEISALKGTNLEGLLEAINTLAELQDLRAKRDGLAEGVVLEARKDSGKGSVATVLIKSGSLQRGSVIHTDQAFAKVRVMFNDRGQVVSKATPSTPVEVLGWRDLPAAGDELVEVESEQEAHKIVNRRKTILHEQKMEEVKAYAVVVEPAPKGAKGAPREPLRKEDNSDKLNIVVKGDVIGSVEAICDALNTYTSRRVKLTLLSAGVGPVSETDLRLAAASEGVVYGFNVKISKQMKTLAKQLGISVNLHEIIYKLLEDLKDDLSSRLPPREEEELVGEAVILKVFELTGSRKAVVGGCRVKKGYLVRDSQYRITRGHECVYEGKLSSMKRGLEDIGQAKRETECGLSFVKFKDVQEGDIVQCYNTTVMKQQIDWEWGF